MLPEEVIKQAIEESDVPHYLEKLIESKPYQLSPEVEQVMASLSLLFKVLMNYMAQRKCLILPSNHLNITM